MPEYLSSAGQLKDIFKIDDLSSIYKNYSVLANRMVGFSVEREYPEDIRFKAPYNARGIPDVVAIIHVVYAHPSEFGNRFKDEKIPIYLTILPYSKYISVHRDYNFDDPESPTRESVSISDSTPRPKDVRILEDYYYDHQKSNLQNKKGKVVSGEYILNDAFSGHCRTVKRAVRLRLGIIGALRNIRIWIYGKIISSSKYILDKLFGRKLITSDGFSGIFAPYKKEDVKMEKGPVINILGYETSKKVVLTFCFLYLLIISIIFLFRLKKSYMEYLTSNNLAVICTAIGSIWILDFIIPQLLFFLINCLLKKRKKLIFEGIKI